MSKKWTKNGDLFHLQLDDCAKDWRLKFPKKHLFLLIFQCFLSPKDFTQFMSPIQLIIDTAKRCFQKTCIQRFQIPVQSSPTFRFLWVPHIKIVKIRPSPLPPTSRAVSISIHSQALLRGVSDDQYLYQIVYCLLRTTIKSYSHLELYLDNHLYNPYSTSGLLQVWQGQLQLHICLTQLYKTFVGVGCHLHQALPCRQENLVQPGAWWWRTWASGAGKRGRVAGAWELVCCVLGVACRVLVHALSYLHFK